MDQLVPDPRGYWRHHPAANPPPDVAAERARWQRVLAQYLTPDRLHAVIQEVINADHTSQAGVITREGI
jgi:hypothetical protein